MKILNKTRMVILLTLIVLNITTSVVAAPITNLQVSSNEIRVGDNFDVIVTIDNDQTDALLSFGFDVFSSSSYLRYTGYTLDPYFDVDTSFGAINVSAAAFPLIPPSLLSEVILATLSFEALQVGSSAVEVAGLNDGSFFGLFYENAGFNIGAQVNIDILQAQNAVSAPKFSVIILLLFVLCIALSMRKKTQCNNLT